MVSGLVWIMFKELFGGASEAKEGESLREHLSDAAQDHEEEIARYLETAPSYCGVGTIVGDVLDPSTKVVLFPGKRTDGVYVWQAELPYYVRKYHLRVPHDLVQRMQSLNWEPPTEQEIDWERLGMARS